MKLASDNELQFHVPAIRRARYETPRLIVLGSVTELTGQANSAVKNVGPSDGRNPARPV